MRNARPLARRLARGALGLAWLTSLGALGSLLVPAGPAGALGMTPAPGRGRAEGLIAQVRGRFHGVLPEGPSPAGSPGPARLDHRLPERAGAMRVADRASGLWAESSLVGARPSRGERTGSLTVYEGALGEGAHQLVHASGESVEDFVLLPSRPSSPELSFSLSLSPEVAGLRLIAGSLELLDQGGAPRLRVAPPYLVDAAGQRHEARVELGGCEADRDPAPPWGRPVTPPGASSCTLRVRWRDEGVSYPALVDPSWQPTSLAGSARAFHTQSLLPSGKILITGGSPKLGDPPLATAELFDPDTSTFTLVGSTLAEARMAHTATVLPSGKVLLAGGLGQGGASLASVELFDGVSFSALPAMGEPRAFHVAIAQPASGKVLVLGGLSGSQALSSVEAFDPLSGKWNGAAPMTKARSHHAAVVLEGGVFSGRVLVAGGQSGGGVVKEAEVFNPDAPEISQAWAPAGNVPLPRLFATLTEIAGGQALLAGGCTQPSASDPLSCASPIADAEVFVASPAPAWVSPKHGLTQARWGHSAVRGRDGSVFLAGGQIGATSVAKSVERFDPVANDILKYDSLLSAPRRSASAGLTRWGAVLMAGGITEGGQVASNTADLLPLAKDGTTCTDGSQCGSGRCVENVCCDSDCNGPCQSCLASVKSDGSANGTCGPAKAGENPGSRCADQTAAACGTKASCDAAGKCATYVGEACGDPYCSFGLLYVPTCVAPGAASCNKKKQTGSCAPYAGCVSDSACASSCTKSSECTQGFACKNNACVPVEGLGTACMSDDQCQSGHCVDQICCTTECTDRCESCFASEKADGSADGLCGPAKQGADPHGRCTDECSDNDFVEKTCSGLGSGDAACTPTVTPCGAAQCTSKGCGSASCTKDAHCAPGARCVAGQCLVPLADGKACDSDEQCQNLHCEGGVCCHTECKGPCLTCKAELKAEGGSSGSCEPVKQGTPDEACHGGQPGCSATGLCNGSGSCAFPPEHTPCGPDECSPDHLKVVVHQCNPTGVCLANVLPCGNSLVCSGGQCLQKCTANADCASGSSCTSDGRCIDLGCLSQTRYRTVSGENDCQSGRLCLESDPTACASRPCQSSADCLPGSGLVCRLDGTCAPPLSAPTAEPDCGCRLPGTPPPAGPAAPIALLALALAARTRRSRR